VGKFSDGESQVEILENVRGCDVFIIQPTCGPSPAETLMELLVIVDALKRSSAARITAVVPYFGYSRQDRRSRLTRVPITAKLAAKMVEASGVDRILTVDLHADQIQGFFNIPIDNIYAQPVLIGDILSKGYDDVVVVSPDVGGVVRARAAAKRINDADLAIIDKRRPAPNMVKVMNVIGDVEGRTCIIIDDMVDTAGTLCQAANILKEKGAKNVVAYATHAVLSGNAIDNINNSELDELVTTNTIPLSKDAANCDKIRQLSIAPTMAEVIKRISEEESISTIFTDTQ
ncbi:MAG: ribose-phosphate pyrophosphokinase, partial [Candidatus Ruthia sp.]|nr:ribose-phosphate pyrophosphokinase [Candidatus Ruthturnera sp.]